MRSNTATVSANASASSALVADKTLISYICEYLLSSRQSLAIVVNNKNYLARSFLVLSMLPNPTLPTADPGPQRTLRTPRPAPPECHGCRTGSENEAPSPERIQVVMRSRADRITRIESTQMLECFFHIFSSGVAAYTIGWRLLSVVENLEKDIFQCALHARVEVPRSKSPVVFASARRSSFFGKKENPACLKLPKTQSTSVANVSLSPIWGLHCT